MSLLYSPGIRNNPQSFGGTESRFRLTDRPPQYLETPSSNRKQWQHLYVLPVLLFEFLALALSRAVLPSVLLHKYGSKVYLVMGFAEFVRGLLAFVACPLFGKASDVIGRRVCLFITVMGTCAPVCSLAFFSWEVKGVTLDALHSNASSVLEADGASDEAGIWPIDWSKQSDMEMHPFATTVFVILFSLSGIFSSTFTLVFAYISDTVRHQDERVSAYGLALATFGLSFTIGPMAGGYLAQYNKQYVFITSLILTIVDLIYIYLFLPESRDIEPTDIKSSVSLITLDHNFSWNPWDTVRLIALDPFLRKVGEVAFLYYTALWALISTLSVYAVQRFKLSPERLGELISALGLCTMLAEAVLVRIVVPMFGEKRATKIGLISFGIQCVVLGFAYESWHLFVCAAFSLAGNLVYPSLSSLVSGSVEPDAVGEALGAINGVKALTEGIGPLLFGSLMTLSEHSALPGWPYLLAAVLVIAAYKAAGELPGEDDHDFVHELDRKKRYRSQPDGIVMRAFGASSKAEQDEEYEGLLSEIDESDDEAERDTSPNAKSEKPTEKPR